MLRLCGAFRLPRLVPKVPLQDVHVHFDCAGSRKVLVLCEGVLAVVPREFRERLIGEAPANSGCFESLQTLGCGRGADLSELLQTFVFPCGAGQNANV